MKGSLNERICQIYERAQRRRRSLPTLLGGVRTEIWRAVVVPAETYYEIWDRMNEA
jgi:hypothetical protein